MLIYNCEFLYEMLWKKSGNIFSAYEKPANQL